MRVRSLLAWGSVTGVFYHHSCSYWSFAGYKKDNGKQEKRNPVDIVDTIARPLLCWWLNWLSFRITYSSCRRKHQTWKTTLHSWGWTSANTRSQLTLNTTNEHTVTRGGGRVTWSYPEKKMEMPWSHLRKPSCTSASKLWPGILKGGEREVVHGTPGDVC